MHVAGKALYVASVIFSTFLGPVSEVRADSAIEQTWVTPASAQRSDETLLLNHPQSWSATFDNDVLVPGHRDQDYTYGSNVHFSGAKVKNHWLSLHAPLYRFDKALGIATGHGARRIEYGLFGFTPEDIGNTAADNNDRPYASLVYVASTNEYYDFANNSAWNSTLTLGALGLSAVGEVQKGVHTAIDGDKPQGWQHQISEGGEPTFRLSIARQQLLSNSSDVYEIKSSLQVSLGYITELNLSIGGRLGRLRTPWLSFTPELASYGEESSPATKSRIFEHYLWGGLALKARAYNAFLQGQFRDSEVVYSESDLHHAIVEAWLGYTISFENGYRLSYAIRGHSSEIKHGQADRNVLWGGIQLAKTFGA